MQIRLVFASVWARMHGMKSMLVLSQIIVLLVTAVSGKLLLLKKVCWLKTMGGPVC